MEIFQERRYFEKDDRVVKALLEIPQRCKSNAKKNQLWGIKGIQKHPINRIKNNLPDGFTYNK